MSTRPTPRPGLPTLVLSLLLGVGLGVACGPPPGASCRANPFCDTGGLGAFCNNNGQCAQGGCCDNKDCGENGMCALTCNKDKDCPGDQTCHGGWCYFQCGFDEDCADGQRCKDDHFCSWD